MSKIVFFGTPEFASIILKALVRDGHEIVGIVTRPDRKKGRGLKFSESEIKIAARELCPEVPLFQPEKVSKIEMAETLKALNADIFVVAAFGEIVSERILMIPPFGCINVHGSLLPYYRGAAPIQRAVMEGATKTGVAIMHMVRKMDAGDVIEMAEVEISPDTTSGELMQQLAEKGASLLLKVIPQLLSGTAPRVPQNEEYATYAPKVEWEECRIDWNKSARDLHNLIRGANPEPGAFAVFHHKGSKKTLKIWKAKALEGNAWQGKPGEIIGGYKDRLIVMAGQGAIEILELQIEGKKRLPVQDVLRGMPIKDFGFDVL